MKVSPVLGIILVTLHVGLAVEHQPRKLLRNNGGQRGLSDEINFLYDILHSTGLSGSHGSNGSGRNVQEVCAQCEGAPHNRQLQILQNIHQIFRGATSQIESRTPSSETTEVTVYDVIYFFLGAPTNTLLSVFGIGGLVTIAAASLLTIVAAAAAYALHRKLGTVRGMSTVVENDYVEVTVIALVDSIMNVANTEPIKSLLQRTTVADLLDRTSGILDDVLNPVVFDYIAGALDGTRSFDQDLLNCHLDALSCETRKALTTVASELL